MNTPHSNLIRSWQILTLLLMAVSIRMSATDNMTNSPKVTLVRSTGKRIALDEFLVANVTNLAQWAAVPGNDASKLVPFINGRQLAGLYPEEIHLTESVVHFHLEILPGNREVWDDIFRRPTASRLVAFSVGPEGQSPFDSTYRGNNKLTLTIIPARAGLVSIAVIVFIGITLFILARTTNLIRDSGPSAPGAPLRPYNMGRAQMACWFFLIISSYLLIWLITGNLDTITPSLLGLMGISAGTALGDVMIDNNKTAVEKAQTNALTAEKTALQNRLTEIQTTVAAPQASVPDPGAQAALSTERTDKQTRLQLVTQSLERAPSQAPGQSAGFLQDILSDGAGYSFHRFQIFAWTLALMIIFVTSVYRDLKMPEFSATLLGLMGISAGTYIGFKFPEE